MSGLSRSSGVSGVGVPLLGSHAELFTSLPFDFFFFFLWLGLGAPFFFGFLRGGEESRESEDFFFCFCSISNSPSCVKY